MIKYFYRVWIENFFEGISFDFKHSVGYYYKDFEEEGISKVFFTSMFTNLTLSGVNLESPPVC